MNLTSIRAEISAMNMCPSLTTHVLNMIEKMSKVEFPSDGIAFLDTLTDWVMSMPKQGYFEAIEINLVKRYKIPKDKELEVFDKLDELGRVYVFYNLLPITTEDSKQSLEDYRNIAKQAQKLKELLPTNDSGTFALIAVINQLETRGDLNFKPDSDDFGSFFEYTHNVLDALIKIPDLIPQSDLAKFMKLGTPSAKGNLSLRVWVEQFYYLWMLNLNRALKFDNSKGVNGRKRLIEFAYETLVEIHPTLTFESVENALTSFLNKQSKSIGQSPP